MSTPVAYPLAPPVPPTPLTAVRWRPWGALGIVALMIAFNVAGTMPAVLLADRLSTTARQTLLFVGLLAYYAATLGVVTFAAHRRGVRLVPAVGLNPTPWDRAAGLAIGWSVLARMAIAAYALLTTAFGYEPTLEFDPTQLFAGNLVGAIELVVFAVIAAPFVEETVFRGIVFPAFASRFGVGWGVAVSAVLFGLIHLQGYNTVPFIGLGVLFAVLFRTTGSLWTAVLCHAAFNLASIILLYVVKASGAL